MLTGKPDRLPAFDYLGLHHYFLTFCTFERARAFELTERVDLVRTQFRRACVEERFALLAYCFMPEHVHLLVEARADDSHGLRFIRSAKQYSGFHYRRVFGVTLWQRYGFERVLRNNEDSLRVARYILENPMRAGLVRNLEDYPFLGSDLYSIAQIREAIQFESRWYRSG